MTRVGARRPARRPRQPSRPPHPRRRYQRSSHNAMRLLLSSSHDIMGMHAATRCIPQGACRFGLLRNHHKNHRQLYRAHVGATKLLLPHGLEAAVELCTPRPKRSSTANPVHPLPSQKTHVVESCGKEMNQHHARCPTLTLSLCVMSDQAAAEPRTVPYSQQRPNC